MNVLPRLNRNKLEPHIITVWGSGALEGDYRRLSMPIYFAGTKLTFHSKNPLLKLYLIIIAPITFFKLLVILHRIKPSVVMTCLSQADILGTLAAWLSRVPKRIVRQADVQRPSWPIRFLKKALALNLATQMIANSQNTKLFLSDYFGVPPEKVVVIPNGIDFSRFASSIHSPKTSQDLAIGFVGRLEPVKGVKYLLEALSILKEKLKLIPPVIIGGDGSLRSDLENYVRSKNLTNVDFRGEIFDVADMLKPIDVLVVPSLHEGFGIVVLEGLAAHKIIVASDLPATRALITTQENGILFPIGDSKALAMILSRLLTQPLLSQRLHKGIQQWFQRKAALFDISHIAQRYELVILS